MIERMQRTFSAFEYMAKGLERSMTGKLVRKAFEEHGWISLNDQRTWGYFYSKQMLMQRLHFNRGI